MRGPGTRRLLVGLGALVLLAGCSSSNGNTDVTPPPDAPAIAFDTPELVALKAQAGVADCVPGTAGSALPAVTLPCLGGGPSVELSSLRGPMVVNLWQSACQPCREEMPLLGAFHERYGAQVPVLGIDMIDTLPGKALEQAGKRGATYPQLVDYDGALLAQAAFARANRGLPLTVFVDAAGEVRGEHSGAITSAEQLTDLVQTYLGVDL